MNTKSLMLLAAISAAPALAAPPPHEPAPDFNGRPALIGTICAPANPKLRLQNVLYTQGVSVCCGPTSRCAQPIAATVLAVPPMPGHT